VRALQLVFLFQGPANPREVERRLGPQVGSGLLDQRGIDPAADLQEATERNAREAREEEADRRVREQVALSAASAERALAQAEAQATEKERLAEAVRRQEPLLVAPLNTAPPPPEFEATARGAGGDYPIREREGDDVAMADVFVLPPPPTPPPPASEPRDEQPVASPVPPVENTVVTILVPTVHIPTRRHLEKAASAPCPQELGATSSSIPDTEATSAAPVGWIHGGGTSALNQASLDVQAKLRVEAEALKRCNEAYLESCTTIQVSCLWVVSFNGPLSSLVGAYKRTHWV